MRNQSGSSLVELLVATCVMSIISVAFLGAMVVNYKTSGKVSNVMENVNTVRAIKEKISRDVREGRFIGSVYGGGDVFPALGIDPCYGNGQQPPNGWPADWPNSYQVSTDTLIVQVPILDDHSDAAGVHTLDQTKTGWPTMIQTGQGAPATASNCENVETHVYRIVPDPVTNGEWVMQFASFPGYAVAGYDRTAHSFGPQTIVSGIIGPIDQNTGAPKVFQYIDKTNTTGANAGHPTDSILPDGSMAANYTGVVVNLEIRKHQTTNTNRKDISIVPVGLKMEVFLRNNALATVAGN